MSNLSELRKSLIKNLSESDLYDRSEVEDDECKENLYDFSKIVNKEENESPGQKISFLFDYMLDAMHQSENKIEYDYDVKDDQSNMTHEDISESDENEEDDEDEENDYNDYIQDIDFNKLIDFDNQKKTNEEKDPNHTIPNNLNSLNRIKSKRNSIQSIKLNSYNKHRLNLDHAANNFAANSAELKESNKKLNILIDIYNSELNYLNFFKDAFEIYAKPLR
jgi:hypothetical protein